MNLPYRVTPTTVTIFLNGKTHTITEGSNPNYTKIREAIRTKDFDSIEALVNVVAAVNTFGNGKIQVVNGVVMYGQYALHNTLTKRILEQMADGFDVEPMIKFLTNLMENPSKRAVDELFDFLEATDLPITDDGHFVAYKRVLENYNDIYSNAISNAVGQVVEMPRNMVDEEKSRTCSQGLHFCSESYLTEFGSSRAESDRVMILKINPRDVVAIPIDYNFAKGRTCRYEVIGETEPMKTRFYTASVYPTTDRGDSNEAGDAELYNDVEDNVLDENGILSEDDEADWSLAPVNPEPQTTPVKPAVEGSIQERGKKLGLVLGGKVRIRTVDGKPEVILFHEHATDAVERSAETKSVRPLLRAKVEELEAAQQPK